MTIQVWQYLSLAIKAKKLKAHGFTLIELLVSMIIASLVTSGLLYLVNEVIRVDRRESTLENVQRDMQRAMNYVSDDLREAVYVYSTPTTVTSLLTASNLPQGSAGRAATPVLAFWKPEFLSPAESASLGSVDCAKLSSTPAPLNTDCQALKLRQSYYSLVVYFTLENTPTDRNPNWAGQGRIIRYSLPQYKKSVIGTTGARTSGYRTPDNDYINWTPSAGETTAGDWSVLVDYVDLPTANPPLANTSCNEFGTNYRRSPSTASTSNSFLACISAPGVVGNGSNQDVVLFLRGNAKTANQAFANPTAPASGAALSQSVLPTLSTRVLVRGAANKSPNGN